MLTGLGIGHSNEMLTGLGIGHLKKLIMVYIGYAKVDRARQRYSAVDGARH